MVTSHVRPPMRRSAARLAALSVSAACIVFPAAAAVGAPAAAGPGVTAGDAAAGLAVAAPSGPRTAMLDRQVSRAQAAYEQARVAVASLGEQTARLRTSAEHAEAEAARLREEVRNHTGGSLVDVLAGLIGDGESDLDRAAEAARNAGHVAGLARSADQALSEAIEETERARLAWEEARAELARVERKWTAREAANAYARQARFRKGYRVEDAAQDRRNRSALRRWQRYLRSLGDAGLVPPPARRLRDPDRLPEPLERLRDPRGRVVVGVAETDGTEPVTALPSQTVRAVSAAFNRVGLPDVPGAIAPSPYACGGFVANSWAATEALPADSVNQWRLLRTVPRSGLQVGDVVVLGSKRHGLEQSGVYVGRRQAILADPETGTAGVQPLPRGAVFGVKRVGLPAPRPYDAPAAGRCGLETTPAASVVGGGASGPERTSTGPLSLPLAPGSYRLTSSFGSTGPLWSSGTHTGLDFAAPKGTPVRAVADGTATVEKSAWAGNLVRIDHGGGVETWYAHLSAVDVTDGRRVRRGEVVGAVGSEGNSTGPHLHLEVRLDGVPVDPAAVLVVPERPFPTYPNGEVPESALCAATADGGQLLRCDAAVAFRLLSASYEQQTGEALCTTDSYRSRAGQERLFRVKPSLAAVPGTSVHGEGRAVDLCGGVERFGTAQHLWLVRNGPRFGWGHPSWAAAGGSRPEPWHFEYGA